VCRLLVLARTNQIVLDMACPMRTTLRQMTPLVKLHTTMQ